MFVSPTDVEVRREQYKDLVREAEHERLAQLALESGHVGGPVTQRLGHQARDLVLHWACRLAPANTLSVCSRL